MEDKMNEIIKIPIDKIKQSRWGTGIRDQEKYDRLKENIIEHGLNSLISVFPVGNEYEPFIGDHRLRILKELDEREVTCIVKNISKQEALERCVSDNTCRADYSSVELENKTTEMYESGKYKFKAELGRKIGLTGQRVGQLLTAKKMRDDINNKSKILFTVPTDSILFTKSLTTNNDRVRLLNLIQDGKIHTTDIKKVAKLCQSNEMLKKKILYKGIPYQEAINNTQPKKVEFWVNKKRATIKNINEMYTTSKNIETLMSELDNSNKKEAINYLKMTVGLIVETLYNEKEITTKQFTQIKDIIIS